MAKPIPTRAILSFWRDLEFFLPFDLREVLIRQERAQLVGENRGITLPWLDPTGWELDPEFEYGYDLFLGLFDQSEMTRVVRELALLAKEDSEFNDSNELSGLTCVLRIAVDRTGWINPGDLKIATLPWALTNLRAGKPLSLYEFEQYGELLESKLITLSSDLISAPQTPPQQSALFPSELLKQPTNAGLEECLKQPTRSLTFEDLRKLSAVVRESLDIRWLQEELVVITPYPLRKKRAELAKKGEAAIAPSLLVDTLKLETTNGSVLDHNAPAENAERPELNQGESAQTEGEKASKEEPASDELLQRKQRRFEILNSFFLADLQRLAQADSDTAKGKTEKSKTSSASKTPFESYFNAQQHPLELKRDADQQIETAKLKSRVDLISNTRALAELTVPDRTNLGHWFFPAEQQLALMQQCAVNHYLTGSESLVAVNGPPGTGKTTILKEITAAVLIERAYELAKLSTPDKAFESQKVEVSLGRHSYEYYPLKSDLTGFEIVVASSNNGAVENVSKELPRRAGLAEEYKVLSYLEPTAALLAALERGGVDQPQSQGDWARAESWGLLSAALGNRRNRERFNSACFFGPTEKAEDRQARIDRGELLTLFEWRRKVPKESGRNFARCKQELKELYQRVRSEINRLQGSEAASYLHQHQQLRNEAAQLAVSWITPEFNQLRSKLLAKAIELHECWVRESRFLDRGLVPLSRLIGRPTTLAPDQGTPLWQLLFMVVPVISTTLASIERMFSSLGANSIGNLLIDEAGQATPGAIAGALWRAKRALVIGDPAQIEPVFTVPVGLVQYLERRNGVKNALLSPLTSSAQQLADAASSFGGMIDPDNSASWVGCPLRVHRRCQEPMFSISNLVAYNGSMISATPAAEIDSPLGASSWFDLQGSVSSKQWVEKQGLAAAQILEIFLLQNRARWQKLRQLPDLFFITPFREVRAKLIPILSKRASDLGASKAQVAQLRRRIGTVHTFQGKEADTVVLVLGCDESTFGAALWAGSKPNLLNVAVSRARNQIYVLGDLSIWHRAGIFSTLVSELPQRSFREVEDLLATQRGD